MARFICSFELSYKSDERTNENSEKKWENQTIVYS